MYVWVVRKNIFDSEYIESTDTWTIFLILSFLMDEFLVRYMFTIYVFFFTKKGTSVKALYANFQLHVISPKHNHKLNLNVVFLPTHVIKETINANMLTLLYLEYYVYVFISKGWKIWNTLCGYMYVCAREQHMWR